jgi:hypothetical protein
MRFIYYTLSDRQSVLQQTGDGVSYSYLNNDCATITSLDK